MKTNNLTAEQLMVQSAHHNDTVRVDFDAAVAADLLAVADDSVETESRTEFRGRTQDGNTWRVHMSK